MSYTNKLNTIIHPIGEIDLVNYVYNTIIATTTSTLVINGESIVLPSGTTIDIIVRTLTGPSTGVILLGSPKANYTANPNL